MTDRPLRSAVRICRVPVGPSALLMTALCLVPPSLYAQTPAAEPTQTPLPNQVLGQVIAPTKYAVIGESTFILQALPAFHNPYAGTNSLPGHGAVSFSHTYALYAGVRLTPRLEAYLNPEIALGNGIGAGDGLGAYSNGDLIGQPSLRADPYLARAFLRWRIPLVSSQRPKPRQIVSPGNDVIGGSLPAARLVLIAGKLAVSDHIDVNAYANNARTQFLNAAFINNVAYDRAGDTRGYTHGVVASVLYPNAALRFGFVAPPTVAGGVDTSYHLPSQHSEQAELELHPEFSPSQHTPLIVRLLAYRNVGTMGHYADALSSASGGAPPDVTAVRRRGAEKYGFGLNFEQALADSGASGVFGRLGWNDGHTETFSTAEVDRVVSLGGQISGAHWHRASDVLGVAIAQSDLSGPHKAYLAAGGLGLALGDGALSYGSERVVEAYYAYQLSPKASLSPGYQFIQNPGFNRARGPASVASLRLHVTF